MRPGGGKKKGSLYEKKIAKIIGKWWAPKLRNPLWRSRGSGAEWTVSSRGREQYPGDIVPARLEAIKGWCLAIECKNDKRWKFEQQFKKPFRQTILGVWWCKLQRETPNHYWLWLVVTRNHDVNYLITTPTFHKCFVNFLGPLVKMRVWHNIVVYRLEDVLKALPSNLVREHPPER